MAEFADELKKAQTFGKLTQFGRGLPRGGEAIAARSLQRQEEILRKLATYSPDGQVFLQLSTFCRSEALSFFPSGRAVGMAMKETSCVILLSLLQLALQGH